MQNFLHQLKSHPCSIDLLFSHFPGTCLSSYFLYLCSSHLERLSLLPCCAITHSVVNPTTVYTPPIREPFSSLFCGDPPPACAEVHLCGSCISSHCSSGSSCGILWTGRRSGGRSETYPANVMLCSFLHLSLSGLIIPPLTHCHKRGEFFWHLTICERVFHFI